MPKRKTKTKSTKKPKIYLDTCIARDVTHQRNDVSRDLFMKIKRKEYNGVMSVFGLMELADIEQEDLFVRKKFFMEKQPLDKIYNKRKSRDLLIEDLRKSNKYIDNFINDYDFITFMGLDDENWGFAISTKTFSNLNAADVVHLATSWQAGCDVIVTRDAFFINEAKKYLKKEKFPNGKTVWSKLKICIPEHVDINLKRLGYTNI